MNMLERNNRIANIKSSLKKLTIVSKNSLQVVAREEKIRSRRQSLQLAADSLQSYKLMRMFSDQDQEEERMRINSFNEKYRLLEKIGEGGNAKVCTCQYLQSGKIYAVKMVRMDEEHYLELKKNFLSMKMLKHPNIIKYHALYFDLKKHLAYLIMEYFPFKNLLELELKEQADLKTIFIELFDAIAYIHQRNVCHRDIKPENILYDPLKKKIKLIDFGISKRTFQRGQRRDMLTIIGTPFYLAPEILMGGGYDEKVDVWSTGITIYQLVARVTPFESENQYHAQTIDNIIKGDLYFGPIWDNYSYLLKDLCCRLLKPRKQRLSAKEALRHFWISQNSPGKMRRGSQNTEEVKFLRAESGNLKVFRTIVEEQTLNIKHATSKQQGEAKTKDSQEVRPKFLKCARLNLMQNKEFDLDDSSDQDTSPSTACQQQRE